MSPVIPITSAVKHLRSTRSLNRVVANAPTRYPIPETTR